MRTAFKDWAAIVDALGRGGQILVLRKGGIHDASGLFQPEHSRFWLFPTLFHQQEQSILPVAQTRFADSIQPLLNDEFVEIKFLAELHSAVEIKSLEAARRLDGQHIWRSEVIENRFDWGNQKSIYALLLRVFALPDPVRLSRSPEYGGCRSWIELDMDIPEKGLRPVLSDDVFESQVTAATNALNDNSTAT